MEALPKQVTVTKVDIKTRNKKPSDLILDLSPRQLPNSKLHQHVKQWPKVIMATHFLEEHNRKTLLSYHSKQNVHILTCVIKIAN